MSPYVGDYFRHSAQRWPLSQGVGFEPDDWRKIFAGQETGLGEFLHCMFSHTTSAQAHGCNSISFWGSHLSDHLPAEEFAIKIVTNAAYGSIKDRVDGGVHVFRNPLNLIVSAYFSHRNTHALDGWPQLERQRRLLRACDLHDGIWATIAFLEREDFYSGAVGPLHGLRQWDFDDGRFVNIRAEDLFRTPDLMGRLLPPGPQGRRLPDAEDYLFENFTNRQVGVIDETSHYRSGHNDQWRSVLPPSAIRYVRTHFAFMSQFYPEAFEDNAQTTEIEPRLASYA